MAAFTSFCTLSRVAGNYNREYRVRFNVVSSKLFDGVMRVRVGKAPGYIVLTPESNPDVPGLNVCHSKRYTVVSFSGLVAAGHFHPSLFDGTRYVVRKSNKNNGRIYICLNEPFIDGRDAADDRSRES